MRGFVNISCRVRGLSPHLLIFQVNNPALRVSRGVESDGERIFMIVPLRGGGLLVAGEGEGEKLTCLF